MKMKTKVREKICWKCGETYQGLIETCPSDGSRLLDLNPEDLDDPFIGTLYDGRYRIVRKLGEGGMGTVYAARQVNFEREVALKILKDDYLKDKDIQKRFMYEARTISNLRHPNALRLFDFGQAPPNSFYMVMELLEGESLADRLAYTFLTYRQIFDCVPPICGVLGEAHENDVVHRDLKPENIFIVNVKGEEFPKLLDFGIAKHLTGDTMTQTGTLWGTPAYMSPEQAKGAKVGGSADIYAIGVMLYELICGNLPFHSTTQMGLAMKHISVPARPLCSIPGLNNVPPELDALIMKALRKDPADRPQSMKEFAAELIQIRHDLFSEELLDNVPAEEVDAIELQQWIADEPELDDEIPAIQIPDRNPTTSEQLRVNGVTGDFAVVADLSAELVSASKDRPWVAVFAGAILLGVAGAGAFAFSMFSSDSTSQVVYERPSVMSASGFVDSAGTSDSAGGGASTAAYMVLEAQKLAESMEPDSEIVFDEAAEDKPETRRKKRRKKKKAAKAKRRVENALEKTF